jgi:uncharacterized protein (DUF433 family)
MTATTSKTGHAPDIRTEHPHVVKRTDNDTGEPIIDGTRLEVRHILINHRDAGMSPEEIARRYGLTLAQVHDALSYAFDHPDEIEFHIERNKIRNVMREQDFVSVGGRGGILISPHRLGELEIASGTPIYTWETLPSDLE